MRLALRSALRLRLRTGDAAQQHSWPLDTLRCVAFWNHYRRTRSQGWDEFADLGDDVVALRRQVERGMLPLLESLHGQASGRSQ